MTSTSHLKTALAGIYGQTGLAQQEERYSAAISRFRSLAGPGSVTLVRAPGRVNLIGEHTDYNHGYVMPMALDKDIVVVARPRADRLVRLWNMEPERFSERSFELSAAIPSGPLGDWGNYARAAGQDLFRHSGGLLTGMDALVAGAAPGGVPRAAGLSSSSALVVVCAVALAHLNRIEMPKVEFALMCSEAEWYVGTRGGIMDHFISVLAERGHALVLDCRPQIDGRYATKAVRVPDGYKVVICNSGVERQKTRSQYNVRVAECRLAVSILKQTYPHITHLRDVSASTLHLRRQEVLGLIATLPERLTTSAVHSHPALSAVLKALSAPLPADQEFLVQARARHVITENARVLAAVDALCRADAGGFGRLMNEAHASMSQDYGASCQEVDLLADIARRTPGVLGARITGAGWGGCIVALVDDTAQDVEANVVRTYREATGLTADTFVCRSAPGAGLVASI
jgi:galactokinase